MKRKSWPVLLDDQTIIRSAGGIPYREKNGELQIVIVHRLQHNDWSLPKGRLEDGETVEVAAMREVQEETACQCELQEELATIRYIDRSGHPKEIRFWKMKIIIANDFLPNQEIDNIKWISIKEAVKVLTYKTDRMLLKRAFA